MKPPVQCAKCGKTHPRGCTAHRSTDGEPCRNHPAPGGDVCRYHGGKAGQVRAKASRRLARAKVEREVARTLADLPDPVDAADGRALLELRARYRKVVDALWALVGELNLVPVDDLPGAGGTDGIYGRTYHQTGTATGEAKPHVLVVMLDTWSEKLAKIDEACVRLGLEDRRVRLAEAEVEVFARAVDAMLAEVVPAELHGQARAVLASRLRAVEATSVERKREP